MKRLLPLIASLVAIAGSFVLPSNAPASAATVPTPERGIAIQLADDAPLANLTAAQLAAQSRGTFNYVAKSLHANAVSINFPFYMDAPNSQFLRAGIGTPTPSQLASITRVAQRFGLRVQFRPFLSEANFGTPGFETAWRGVISPPDPNAWIAEYGAFLRPYLIQAKKSGVTSFNIAVELNSLVNQLGAWKAVVQEGRTLYGGPLIYSGTSIYQSIPQTQFGWDDYTPVTSIPYLGIPIPIDYTATVGQVTTGFENNLKNELFPAALSSTRLEEIGISAIDGAYQAPWAYYLTGNTDRNIQVNWFTAACNAFFDFHMRGIYFWGLELEFYQPGSTAGDKFQWYGTAGADAIANCFSRTAK